MSKSKAKGSKFEAKIRDYLQTQGAPYAERLPAGAFHDRGDITGTPGVVWECKNQAAPSLGAWTDELHVELRNARCSIGAVIHHRRGFGHAADDFATMPLSIYCQLLREAGYLGEPTTP